MELFDIDIYDERVQFVEAKPTGWAGEIPVKDLRAALELYDIPPAVWPAVPSDNKCLERAMNDLKSSRNLVRPLPKGRGWALVIENGDALDLERMDPDDDGERHAHKVEITAKVERAEDDGQLSTLRVTPEDHPAVSLIQEQFRYHRGTDDENPGVYTASQDLSVWFSQTIIPWLRGITTRSRGGSYYILKGAALDKLVAVSKALEEVSTYIQKPIHIGSKTIYRTVTVRGGRIRIKPELSTVSAIEVLIDGIINEADKLCDDMHENIVHQKKGVRGLQTDSKQMDEMSEKLKQVEDLLGIALDDTRSRLSETQAANGMMQLKLQAIKDAA